MLTPLRAAQAGARERSLHCIDGLAAQKHVHYVCAS
jgi:hypothetical protein